MRQRHIYRTDNTAERGSALIMAIVTIFALTAIGSMLAMIASVDTKISGNQKVSTEALYAAEAGLSEAVHRLALRNPTTATVGTWTGNVAIADVEPYDPNWTARIYMLSPGAAPAGGASDFHTGTFQDMSGSYADYSRMTGTDDVLTIQHKWEDLDSDGLRDPDEIVLYDAAKMPPENFSTGFPVEVISVTGNAAQHGTRRVEAEVTRLPIIGRTRAALYVDKAISVSGTPAFCGWNHDINTPAGKAPMLCFAWHLGTDHLAGITTTGDEIDFKGAGWDCEGDPAPTDTSATNPFFSLAQVLGISQSQLDRLLASADNTSIVDPLDGITYIKGDAKINSNLTGEGLIYITGNLKGNGNFRYKGLIYIEGDLQFTGSPWILGSMVVNGTADFSFAAGSAEILYSKDAIQQSISQFLPMMRLSWREQ